MKNANEEIEKTLNSLNDLQKADASPFLYEKVMARLEKGEAAVISITPRLIWQVAAALALLVALNVFVLTRTATNESKQTAENNPLATEYFAHLSPIQF